MTADATPSGLDAEPTFPAHLLAAVARRIRASASRPVILIDGGSGSGKTTFAHAVLPFLDVAPPQARAATKTEEIRGDTPTDAAPERRVAPEVLSFRTQLVSLDDLYPGWDGLAIGSAAVHETILRRDDPGWRAWDWVAGVPGEWHPIDPDRPLIVEGCGALSRENRALANFGVWLELDAGERRRRALARDGELYVPFWDRWAAQEAAFRAAEPPLPLADIVIHPNPPPG